MESLFKSMFAEKTKDVGLSDYENLFDTEKMSGEKITLAVYLLKFSSEYLLQAFPGGQFSYLSKRIEEVLEEVESMQDTFDKTKQLSEELQEYKEYVMTTKPRSVFPHENMYTAECTWCKDTALGKDRDESINNVKHLSKCKYHETENKDNKEVIYAWFRVLCPTSLEE